jgi:tripartite-type tricarboxylate transporter receptor subunit TctC
MTGQVQALFSSVLPVVSMIKAGTLKAIAIAAERRLELLPDVPTFKESGLDYRTGTWFGLFAPAKTPAPIVQKLNTEFVKALRTEEVRDKIVPQVAFVIPTTPDELGALVARDIVRLGQVVKDSGAKAPDER